MLFRLTAAAVALAAVVMQTVPRGGVTVDLLKSARATSNDPGGDSFIGPRATLNSIVDAFVADNSLASPLYLYLAANTAFRIGRVEDAAFLFYAAQLRKAFDYKRYDISTEPDGNNTATYLAFLNQTTGMGVNPAAMRRPEIFSAAIARIEAWEVVPSPGAYYPEFQEAKGFRLDRSQWAATARAIKDEFLTKFGRRMATLLGDREYFEGFSFVQQVNLGEIDASAPAARQRFAAGMEKMRAAETRLFGSTTITPPPPAAPSAPAAAPRAAGEEAPLRAGGDIKEIKPAIRVEPAFPKGARGSVILEITIASSGLVRDVRVLRGDPDLATPAVAAVRQWVFKPVTVKGKPASLIETVSFTAK